MTSEINPVAWYYERETDTGLSFAPDRDPTKPWTPLYTADALAAAREEALEEAAKVCLSMRYQDDEAIDHNLACVVCADAIRALKEKKSGT